MGINRWQAKLDRQHNDESAMSERGPERRHNQPAVGLARKCADSRSIWAASCRSSGSRAHLATWPRSDQCQLADVGGV